MRKFPVAVSLMALLWPATAGATDYVKDPLTAAQFAGRGSQGGKFAADGWTTTGPTDAIWYEIGDALPSGTISFSVKGISPATTLTGADHDIFTIYQAPTGQAEPVAYSPYYRNNDFKVFTRIFGVQEPGRAGAMKLEFGLCPRGAPWYHDEVCTPECGGGDLAYAYGKDKDIGWDPAASYKISVSWGSGMVSFARDNATLGTINYMGTYAPKPLRVRLGSPRHGISEFAYMPTGITFKDVLIQGTAGAMTPVCGQMATSGSGGGGAGGMAAMPGELGAIQDVTGAAWSPDSVFDDVTDLNVEALPSGEPQGVVYLRFPKPAGKVKQAFLRMHTHIYASAAGGSGAIHGVSDTSWSENTLVWSKKPSYAAKAYGMEHPVTPDIDVEWDVTELVAAGTVDFALVSTNEDGAHYMSKEAAGGTHAPKLIVASEPETVTAGSTSGAGGTSPGPTSAAVGSGGAPSAEAPAVKGGCGCTTAGSSTPSLGALALLAALALRRQRSLRK